MDELRFQSFLALAENRNRQWSALAKARASAQKVRQLILEAIDGAERPVPTDAEVILFGSLARGEWTTGSDIDWSLLIDGQADPHHHSAALRVRAILEETMFEGKPLIAPGSSGTFGQVIFSHDLVHAVGGESDSNQNTTRRILLLLESIPLRQATGAYRRTIRSVLLRYVLDDVRTAADAPNPPSVPRFLLNDIVRFWRTMCVDFGSKYWQQSGKKWAIRNIKLRISRKLLFVSGLLLVFRCYRGGGIELERAESNIDLLVEDAERPPVEIVARELVSVGLDEEAAKLFDIYDDFIAQLDDNDQRKALDRVTPAEAYSDPTFQKFRKMSQSFQNILTSVFFEKDTELRKFTLKYGVF